MVKKYSKKNILGVYRNLITSLAKRPVWQILFAGLLPATLVFYLVYVGFIEGSIETNSQVRASIEKIEAENVQGRSVEAQEPEFRREFARVVSLLEGAEPLLPKQTELASILMGIQTSAESYNVTLTGLNGVQPSKPSPNAGNRLYERELPATVTGNYNDVMQFFNQTSALNRILLIREFSAKSAKPRSASGKVRPDKVEVSFTLLAFHAPPPQDFPTRMPPVASVIGTDKTAVAAR